jgi:transposase
MCATTDRLPGPRHRRRRFFLSADRGAVHRDTHLATYAGLMQADAYAGFNRLYEASRKARADH